MIVQFDKKEIIRVRLGDFDLLDLPGGLALQTDAEGRWCWFRDGNHFYRRTLDGAIVIREEEHYFSCSSEMVSKISKKIEKNLIAFISQCSDTEFFNKINFQGNPTSQEILISKLNRIVQQNKKICFGESERFKVVYPGNIPILPPNRYRDIVVLPASGCPNSFCTFCTFYQNVQFRVYDENEFREHLLLVKRFFGNSLASRKGIFLGSASALSISQRKLLTFLQIVHNILGSRPNGIAAFYDPDHAPTRSEEDFRMLHDADLTHITIGLETGWAELRSKLKKSADLEHIRKTICQLKAAEISCALTVLIGPGGKEAIEKHRSESIALLQKLPLDASDIIYLSPWEGMLSHQMMKTEMDNFRKELFPLTQAKIVPYRIGLFRYFA